MSLKFFENLVLLSLAWKLQKFQNIFNVILLYT